MKELFVRMDLDVTRLVPKGKKLKRPPRQKYPNSVERQYTRDLLQFTADLQKMTEDQLIRRMPALEADARQTLPDQVTQRTDDWASDLIRIINGIKVGMGRKWTDAELARMALNTGRDVSEFQKRAMKEQFKRVLGVDIFLTEPWLRPVMATFADRNVSLIKTIEDKFLNNVNQIVSTGFGQGRRWEAMAEDISAQFDVTDSQAARIARDQTSKLNGQLTMLRQTELGVQKYRWITAGDDRVRESHAEKNGKVFEWSDPPNDTGHPGEDINCRCYAEPVFEAEDTE